MEYKEVLLGDIADVQWGDTSTTKAKYTKSGYRAFSASGNDGNLPYYDYDREGIVLSAIGAACGRFWYTSGKWSCIKNTIRFWSKDETVCLTRYLSYAISPDAWTISGSAQPFITLRSARNYKLNLPDLSTQKKIVHILSAIDQKIELNNQQNKFIEEQASILIQKYNESEKNTIELKEIMSFDNGFAFKSKDYVDSGKYRVITIRNVQDGLIDSSSSQFIKNYPEGMRDCHRLTISDVLVSLTGNVGRVGVVFEENLLLNQRVAKIRPKAENMLPFLYFLFRQKDFKRRLEALAKGTAQLNLSPVETLNKEIIYSEQSALELSNRLKLLFEKIILNNQNNKTLSSIRDSLLPKLMSGEINLDEVEINE